MENEITITEDFWLKIVTQVKHLLPTEMERNRTERYFPFMHTHELKGDTFVIGVDEQLQVEMFTELYVDLINEVLHMNGIQVSRVEFRVNKNQMNSTPVPLPEPLYEKSSKHELDLHPGLPSTMPLNKNYTFENFVQGPSNSFAYAAATAVAKDPGGTTYNPLFIYGGTGLGKTHLMESIGHYVLKHRQEMSVCFITCETFLNEFINALADKAMPAFREKYRKFDMLLLDDVQFIAGKPEFQVEFFNTFNSLMLAQKQVVMTSDVAPKDLKGCEERLTGRFQQGMVVEIELPSYETRLAILKSKAANCHRFVPEEVLKFIAENIRSHVRAIEGALNRIVTFMNLNPMTTLNLDIVQHLLKDSIEEEKIIKDFTVDEIIATVSEFYNVATTDILSKERTQNLVTPRQVAMFLACKLIINKTLVQIASSFNKSHATVYHGAQTIQKRLELEDELKKTVEEILSKMGRRISEITS